MVRKQEKNLLVGLDIGTSKVVAIVGEVAPEGGIEVIGIGSHPSRGLKKGVVVNIESTVQSIQRAIEEAELMAGCEIRSVYAGSRAAISEVSTRTYRRDSRERGEPHRRRARDRRRARRCHPR